MSVGNIEPKDLIVDDSERGIFRLSSIRSDFEEHPGKGEGAHIRSMLAISGARIRSGDTRPIPSAKRGRTPVVLCQRQ